MKSILKNSIFILSLLATVLFTSCEKDNSFEPNQEAEQLIDQDQLNTLIQKFGLEETKYIVLEGKTLFNINKLTESEFKLISKTMEECSHLSFDMNDNEVHVFAEHNEKENLAIQKAFYNPNITQVKATQAKYWLEYIVNIYQDVNYGGRSTTWKKTTYKKNKPKGYTIHCDNVGTWMNDKTSSYTYAITANFPITTTIRFYKNHFQDHLLFKKTHRDLIGPAYSYTNGMKWVGDKYNDQITSWVLKYSYVD